MTQAHSSKALYLRLLKEVRPFWRRFALALGAMIVLALSEPMLAALLKELLDEGFVAKNPDAIVRMPLMLVGLFLVRGVMEFTGSTSLRWVATKVVLALRERMFGKLLSLPSAYFDQHPSGVLVSRFTFDATQVTSASTQVLIVLVKDAVTVLGLLGWVLFINWKLAMVFLVVLPIIGLVVRKVSGRLRKLSRSQQHSMGSMTHTLNEAISGNREIKVFGGADYEQRRFFDVAEDVRRFGMKSVMASAANVSIVQMIAVLPLASIVYYAGLQAQHGEITVGGFVSFVGALALMLSPIKRLTNINEPLQQGLAACESVFGLLDEASEPDTGSKTLGRARGEIAFRAVGFRYPRAEQDALQEIDLRIAPGETVALVGPSGGGKSTLVTLLPRFYQPTQGVITLDGEDIQSLRLTELRANIALVTQHVVLFNDTIAANIGYGAGGKASEADIRRAAEAAHAMEFIERLPEGLNTLIGENGLRLSGGQRQRISIARALLKDAPILLLDEATSALDTESERQVQAAIDNLRAGRTTIIIAHRLSTIVNADRIVVLQGGRIQEIGTHGELLDRRGIYHRLHQLQQS